MTAILRLLILLVPLAGLTGCGASSEFIDRVRETAERAAEGETMEQVPDDGGAAVGLDLYDALQTGSRAAAEGIFFDTGSATLQPASTRAFGEIAEMLGEYPDLRLRIEGHTDDTGAVDANQHLSQQRAEAVKAALVERHGIAADRLTAVGVGPARPVASNDTPEGRRQNRRIELALQ